MKRAGESENRSVKKHKEEEEEEEEESEDEQGCVICGTDETTSKNLLILCDGEGCDIPVHLRCYGVETIPTDEWKCQRCLDGVLVSDTEIICCSSTLGALMRTSFPGKYIHVTCAWWNASVEFIKDLWTVEKWVLDKQTCYICNKSKGLTIKCKLPGCKQWFHVMCAVDNQTIDLCIQKEIKHNVMCQDHILGARSSKPKVRIVVEDTYETSNDSSESEEIDKDVKKEPIFSKKPSYSGPKKKLPSSLSILLDKVNLIKETAMLLESAIPLEFKKPKEVISNSPLDSLLDSAFDGRGDRLLDEKISEILELKAQNQLLQDELSILRLASRATSPVGNMPNNDLENVLAIFSSLKLPNMTVPVESNLSIFLATLRSIIEKN